MYNVQNNVPVHPVHDNAVTILLFQPWPLLTDPMFFYATILTRKHPFTFTIIGTVLGKFKLI